jgi:hypothetical protein
LVATGKIPKDKDVAVDQSKAVKEKLCPDCQQFQFNGWLLFGATHISLCDYSSRKNSENQA